jgi:peptide/nickel transport system permease protein
MGNFRHIAERWKRSGWWNDLQLWVLIACFLLMLLLPDLASRNDWSEQFRDAINAPPSARFLMGTDALGRDRFARILHGTRISMVLGVGAAATATLLGIGAAVGLNALRGWPAQMADHALDFFLSFPWILMLLIGRATLPLNVSATSSLVFLFLLLAMLGWAEPARIFRCALAQQRRSAHILFAAAQGVSRWRTHLHFLLPGLRPLAMAQFCLLIPSFILAETNLGLLGMGVAEPLPTLGNLLRDMEGLGLLHDRWVSALPALVLTILLLLSRPGKLRSTAERAS